VLVSAEKMMNGVEGGMIGLWIAVLTLKAATKSFRWPCRRPTRKHEKLSNRSVIAIDVMISPAMIKSGMDRVNRSSAKDR